MFNPVGVPGPRILDRVNVVAKVHEIALHPTASQRPGPTLELLRDPYTSRAAARRLP